MIHDPRICNAFHSAAENARDAGLEATVTLAQVDEDAEGYARDGLTVCTCRTETTHPTATLNRRQWRMIEMAGRYGYGWRLGEGSSTLVVIAGTGGRELHLHAKGAGVSVFLATQAGAPTLRRLTQREAFGMLAARSI